MKNLIYEILQLKEDMKNNEAFEYEWQTTFDLWNAVMVRLEVILKDYNYQGYICGINTDKKQITLQLDENIAMDDTPLHHKAVISLN